MAKAAAINRSKVYEPIVQALSGERGVVFEESGKKLFPTIREFLTFCALLGFASHKRITLDKSEGSEDIQGVIYEDTEALEFVWLIGVADTKGVEILKDGNERQCAEIFEEYANGGLSILSEELGDLPTERWPGTIFNLVQKNF